MKSDIEIAHEIELKKISEVAESLGIKADELFMYGNYMAKVDVPKTEVQSKRGARP